MVRFSSSKILASAFVAAVVVSPARANPEGIIFFNPTHTPWILTLNGQQFSAVETGYVSASGEANTVNHEAGVSHLHDRDDLNNWGFFDLATFSGPVTSATLTINTETFYAPSGSLTYLLYDTFADLDAFHAGGTDLFLDLASGAFYGSRVYTEDDEYQLRTIELNGTARLAIENAAGGNFALGGTLVPQVAPGVPEPASWALMLAGFGCLGFVMRTRNQVRKVTFRRVSRTSRPVRLNMGKA